MDAKGDLSQYFTGTGIQHFTGQALAKFKLPIPPDAELKERISKLDELMAQTNALQKTYEGKLRSIANLRQSILQKAFAGELTSPPPNAIKEAAE